jgi:hypothetical protein
MSSQTVAERHEHDAIELAKLRQTVIDYDALVPALRARIVDLEQMLPSREGDAWMKEAAREIFEQNALFHGALTLGEAAAIIAQHASPKREAGAENDPVLEDEADYDVEFERLKRRALNLGYVLTPEPEHPDSPHATQPLPDAGAGQDELEKARVVLSGLKNELHAYAGHFLGKGMLDEDAKQALDWAGKINTALDHQFEAHKALASPPPGYAVVPVEPTEEMCKRGFAAFDTSNGDFAVAWMGDAYRAMIRAAAPTPEPDPRQRDEYFG